MTGDVVEVCVSTLPGNIFHELGGVRRVKLDSEGKVPRRVW